MRDAHAHAAVRRLAAQSVQKRRQRRFGGAVRGLAGRGALRRHRTHRGDHPGSPREHARQHRLRERDRAEDVDLEHVAVHLLGGILRRARLRAPRDVEQVIDPGVGVRARHLRRHRHRRRRRLARRRRAPARVQHERPRRHLEALHELFGRLCCQEEFLGECPLYGSIVTHLWTKK